MQLNETRSNGEAKTGAFCGGTRLCDSNERFEDLLLLFGSDSRAIVADFDAYLAIRPAGYKVDPTTFRRELNGVSNEIHEHLFESQSIRVNAQLRLNLLEQRLRFLFRQR